MDRSQKEKLVVALRRIFEDTVLVVVTHQVGLTVAEITDLRRRMDTAGAVFRVTKNRLARLALKDTRFQALSPLFSGPTAIAYSEDPVAAAKVAVEFARHNDKLTIIGGGLGERVLDVVGVRALAELLSLDELRAKLIGLIQSPATGLAGVLQAPAGELTRVTSAYASKGKAA